MIIQEDNGFVLVCDNCGKEVEGFKDYDEAFEYQKNNGWKSDSGINLNLEDSFIDKCPKCLERE